MQSLRSKQYLKAMGITVWEPRGQQPEPAAVAPATAAVPAQPAELSPAQSGATVIPACGTPVKTYVNALAETPVVLTGASQGSLLLVIEPPALTGEATALLTAMLGAIQCDLAAQSIATISSAATQSLSSAVQQTAPQIIIVMAAHHGNAGSLDNHRAALHQPQWASCPVAITIHPHELLADPANKRPAWEDLKRVKARLDG